jgi:tripartite-type tricarboxylate transporter receptor subunit TctC
VDMVADASGWAPVVEDGRFRLLAVWGAERMPRFPDAPTLREAGIDLVVNSPYGIGGPRAMDPMVVRRLHDAFKEALFDPATRAVMARFNMPLLYLDSADYDAASRAQVEIERAGLRRAGLLAPR